MSGGKRTKALLQHDAAIDLGDRLAPIVARVNRRARRLIVKVDAVTGDVLVTAPSQRALPDAIRFAQTRKAWIREQLNAAPKARPFVPGGVCPYQAIEHAILNEGPARAPIRRVDEGTPALVVAGAAEHVNRRVVDWLKKEARRALVEKVDRYAAALGRRRGAIRIRDPRSRWGSCSSEGDLSFSWRLILAPPEILDYVAAHECAHLVHMNHSVAYWRTLKSLGVDVDAAREWFAQEGPRLHAWGVEPHLR